MIYLDNAATSLIKPASVERAMHEALRSMASPGRGSHAPAMRAADTVLDCRIAAAELFHVPEAERVVFTFNATHALNIAIKSLARRGSRVLISGFEHNSVTRPLYQIGAEVVTAGTALFDREAVLCDFAEKMEGADLVVCTQVSNVFGFILPIYEIAGLCHEKGVPLIVDASQSAGVLDVDYGRLKAAFIAMPGHKGLYGPQGTGILLCGQEGTPLLQGGSGSDSIPQHMPDYLPDHLEAGTHNVTGIAGLLAGIRFVQEKGIDRIRRHEHTMLDLMRQELVDEERLELFLGDGEQQSGVLSLRCRDVSCEELAGKLGEQGICVRSGMHCAPTAHRSAGTIDTGTLRFSFSAFTSENEVRRAAQTLLKII